MVNISNNCRGSAQMSIGGRFADASKKELAKKLKLVLRIDTGVESVWCATAGSGGDE